MSIGIAYTSALPYRYTLYTLVDGYSWQVRQTSKTHDLIDSGPWYVIEEENQRNDKNGYEEGFNYGPFVVLPYDVLQISKRTQKPKHWIIGTTARNVSHIVTLLHDDCGERKIHCYIVTWWLQGTKAILLHNEINKTSKEIYNGIGPAFDWWLIFAWIYRK